MTFAETLAELNAWHFFQEFVYSNNTFRPAPPQTEVELADNVLWLDGILFVFQLKERENITDTTAAIERKWFEKKVLNQATRQIRDTLRYLEQNSTIALKNHRGHERLLELKSISQLHKLVVYLPSRQLPEDCINKKYHESKTAGIIHVIPAQDYIGIVRTLLTPAEVADYFDFREEMINAWENRVNEVPETALVGQFIEGDSSRQPSLEFIAQLRALDHRADEWDMSGVISKFPNKVTTDNAPTDYYYIITELALLKRNELREFKTRFQRSIEKSRADELVRPFRIAIPRTDCGFVFIPLTKEIFVHRRTALLNLTLAHKYDLRLSKCIGVAIGNHEGGWFNAEWCYAHSSWVPDVEMDRLLSENNPFRAVKLGELQRYAHKNPRGA